MEGHGLRPPIDRQDTIEALDVVLSMMLAGDFGDAHALIAELRDALAGDVVMDIRDGAIERGESLTQH